MNLFGSPGEVVSISYRANKGDGLAIYQHDFSKRSPPKMVIGKDGDLRLKSGKYGYTKQDGTLWLKNPPQKKKLTLDKGSGFYYPTSDLRGGANILRGANERTSNMPRRGKGGRFVKGHRRVRRHNEPGRGKRHRARPSRKARATSKKRRITGIGPRHRRITGIGPRHRFVEYGSSLPYTVSPKSHSLRPGSEINPRRHRRRAVAHRRVRRNPPRRSRATKKWFLRGGGLLGGTALYFGGKWGLGKTPLSTKTKEVILAGAGVAGGFVVGSLFKDTLAGVSFALVPVGASAFNWYKEHRAQLEAKKATGTETAMKGISGAEDSMVLLSPEGKSLGRVIAKVTDGYGRVIGAVTHTDDGRELVIGESGQPIGRVPIALEPHFKPIARVPIASDEAISRVPVALEY